MATKTKPQAHQAPASGGASLAAKHQMLKNQAETSRPEPAATANTISPNPDTDPLLMVTDLLDQLEVLRPQAIEQILVKRRKLDEQLAKLGYQPGTGAKIHTLPFAAVKQRSAGGATGYNPAKVCPVCGEVGHDGRKHRFDQQKPGQTKETASKAARTAGTLLTVE